MNSDLPAGISPDEAHDYLAAMLDACRKAEQAAALNKIRYMQLARRYGLSLAEIGEYLDMSKSGVFRAFRKAEASVGEGDQVLGGVA
ncbi:hypothetical protein [Nocardia sp. NPDC059239]|uniref:hypothetical protein n=1 Tax=unclassified Nocardia TaxID=2637762 RepID=UPI0036B0AF61